MNFIKTLKFSVKGIDTTRYIVSVANKLITVIYYILKSKKPFDPFYEIKIKGIQPEITTVNQES